MKFTTFITGVLFWVVLTTLVMPAHSADAAADESIAAIKQVIERMNRAVTERDLPELLATFAEGSINLDLFPARKYGASPENEGGSVKTTPLHQRWQVIAPVLFSRTKEYQRTVRDMEVQLDKNMAVAWLDLETRTLPATEDATAETDRFKEICILRRSGDQWKIVAITNNRHDIGQ